MILCTFEWVLAAVLCKLNILLLFPHFCINSSHLLFEQSTGHSRGFILSPKKQLHKTFWKIFYRSLNFSSQHADAWKSSILLQIFCSPLKHKSQYSSTVWSHLLNQWNVALFTVSRHIFLWSLPFSEEYLSRYSVLKCFHSCLSHTNFLATAYKIKRIHFLL